MGVYTLATVNFSAAQETGLDRKLFIHNQSRAAQTPPLPAQTKLEYLNGLVQAWPNQFYVEAVNDFSDRCRAEMPSATIPELQQIGTILGVDPNPYD